MESVLDLFKSYKIVTVVAVDTLVYFTVVASIIVVLVGFAIDLSIFVEN